MSANETPKILCTFKTVKRNFAVDMLCDSSVSRMTGDQADLLLHAAEAAGTCDYENLTITYGPHADGMMRYMIVATEA